MSKGSWDTFAAALEAENRCLGELGAAALAMTSSLVLGTAAQISAADRSVDARRILFVEARKRRAAMMKAGFGELTLRQVCAYAPGPLRRSVFTSQHELSTRSIGLRITISNNKALINAGLQRIAKTIVVMQKSLTEQTGMYRRRGTMAPPTGSLIVSRKA